MVGLRDGRLGDLAALDVLHAEEQLLRVGWVVVCGTAEVDGEAREVLHPLVQRSVRLVRPAGAYRESWEIHVLSDVELTERMTGDDVVLPPQERLRAWALGDPPSPAALRADTELVDWVRGAAAGAGLPVEDVVGPGVDPLERRHQPGLVAVVGTLAYLTHAPRSSSRRGDLLSLAGRPGLDDTALALLYGDGELEERIAACGRPDPLLTADQHALVERVATRPLVAATGPPGTGKTRVLAAAVMDRARCGESVLVVTASPHAAAVIVEALRELPGPTPVRFADPAQRRALAVELADGAVEPASRRERSSAEHRRDESAERVDRIRRTILDALAAEAAFAAGLERRDDLALVAATAPGATDADLDGDELERLVERADRSGSWFARWRAGRARRRVEERLRLEPGASLEDAVDLARAEVAVRRGLAGGGLGLDEAWSRLAGAEAELLAADVEAGRAEEQQRRARATASAADLARALRSGSEIRRELLREVDAGGLLEALPLWVGTLREVAGTLPDAPGLFDLVALDEASQIDQVAAAPALARGRRALVVGDPRQLRHPSFVGDEEMAAAARVAGITPPPVLDVRRNSLLDAALARVPVTPLSIHFRSVPHLIGFPLQRFYDRTVSVATRRPSSERLDVIHRHPVKGRRDDGVNRAEVEHALALVGRLMEAAPGRSVGVVTPFRAQADAIEAEVLARFELGVMEAARLRVGTVHAFQGSERDVVVASFAVDAEDASGRRFLEQDDLFNVMVSRARLELHLVVSVDEEGLGPGLLSDYLRWEATPPDRLADDAGPADAWTAEVAAALTDLGEPVRVGYRVGPWTVDLVLGEIDPPLGVFTRVHPDGAQAHVDAHRSLAAIGWRLDDLFPSRWMARPEEAALHAAGLARRR